MSFLIMLISFPHSLLAYEDKLGLDKKASRLITNSWDYARPLKLMLNCNTYVFR